ncbi:MAG: oxidoreductase [Chitinophagaceae bacterium]
MQQTVLIVGGTSGLGRGLAEYYLHNGNKVAIVGRRQHLLDEIKQQFPQNSFTYQLDISDANCQEQISKIITELGIDLLVLSASTIEFNPDLSFEKEAEMIRTNVLGYTAVLNSAYHYFKKKGSGHIVGITSIAAARGNKTAIAYNASKAFQSSYLEGLRLKLQTESSQIHVTEIIPGYVATTMAKGDRLFWVASLLKAVAQIVTAIEQKKKRVFVTKRWQIIYNIYQFLPLSLYTFLINSKIKFKQKPN